MIGAYGYIQINSIKIKIYTLEFIFLPIFYFILFFFQELGPIW